MSSDDDNGADMVLFRDRPEWSDVIPLAQDDGDHPIVQIAYSETFLDVFGYLRAVIAKREMSERALELTTEALQLNPANYTVWQYRRDILAALKSDLHVELAKCEVVILENAKNYQVWHHRRCIVELLNDSSHELTLTAAVLDMDAKNYHAWQHRQWAIKTYDLFDDELAYVDKLISADVRNNSAWNQRFFVLKHTGLGAEVLQREVKYALTRIQLVKNNESSWSFLRGLLLQGGDGTLDQFAEVADFCEELYTQNCRSPHLLAFLIDMYEERCMRTAAVRGSDVAELQRLAERVKELCDSMKNRYDKIREKYWAYVEFNFTTQFERLMMESPESKTGAAAGPNAAAGVCEPTEC